jgi:hypothetical protein
VQGQKLGYLGSHCYLTLPCCCLAGLECQRFVEGRLQGCPHTWQ